MPRTNVKPFYIVLTAIADGSDDYPTRWRDYRHQMITSVLERDPTPADQPAPGATPHTEPPEVATGVIWRLCTGMHREMAGSARLFPDAAAARADAQHWVLHSERLVVHRVMTETLDRFAWFATLDDEPVILAHRWYSTRRDRTTAATAVLAHLPGTLVAQYLQDTVVPGHTQDVGWLPMLEEDLADCGPQVRERLHAQRLRELRRDQRAASSR